MAKQHQQFFMKSVVCGTASTGISFGSLMLSHAKGINENLQTVSLLVGICVGIITIISLVANLWWRYQQNKKDRKDKKQ